MNTPTLALVFALLLVGCADRGVARRFEVGGDAAPRARSGDFLALDPTVLAPGEALGLGLLPGDAPTALAVCCVDLAAAAGEAAPVPAAWAEPSELTAGGFRLRTLAAPGWVDGSFRSLRARVVLPPGERQLTVRFLAENQSEQERSAALGLYWRVPPGMQHAGQITVYSTRRGQVLAEITPRLKVIRGDLLHLLLEDQRFAPGHGVAVDCETEVTP